MADIEYVQAGQKIKASTMNSIINSLGGEQCPSDGGMDFQRTSSGSIFMTPSQVHGAPEQHAPQLLDVAWGPSLSGEQQLVIQLGRSLSSTADILQSHPLSVFFRDYSGSTQSAGKLVPLKDEDFKPNGDGKFFDGWLSTGIWGLNPAGNSNETSALDGTLWLHDVTGDNGSAWVITNAHKFDSFKEELMTKMSWESAFPLSKTPLAVQMKSSLTADEAGGMLVRIHQAVPASDETPCLFQLRAEVETQLSSDGSEQKRAVFQWWDDSSTTSSGVQWNTYKFDGPTSQSARWTELSATEWAAQLPRCDMPVWLKVEAAGRNPAKSDTDYLQIKQWSVTTEKQDDEECIVGGLESGGLGTRWVRAYYPIGRFFSNGIDGAIRVEQSHLGSLNILDMSWGGDGGGSAAPLSGDDSQRYTADSLLSALSSSPQMSSVTRDAYVYEYENVLSDGTHQTEKAIGYYFSLFNFKNAQDPITISCRLSDDYHIDDRLLFLVRDSQAELGKETTPVLKYASLSIEPACLDTDAEISGSDSWSIQLSAHDKIKRIAQLYNFSREQKDGTITLSSGMTSLPDGTHILARVKDGDTWKLQYMDVSVDLSSSAGNLISADSEVTSLSSNSIQAVETDDGTSAIAFQLYDFEKGGSTQSLPSELSGWSILARCRDNGVSELKYVEASAMSHPVPDSTVDFLMQKSVDKAEADGKEILQLHDFGTDGKALDISFSQDSTTLSDGIEILARQVQDDGTRELRYAKMSISFGNLRELSADTEEAESATKSIDCDSNVLKLHDFSGTSRSVSLKLEDTTSGKQIPGDVSLLVRKDNELKYANLEIEFPDLSSPEAFEQLSGHFIADSASDLGISSVQEVEKGGKKVFSAWQFGDRDFHMPRESAAKASDIIIRDRDSMQLKYVEMSSLALDTDSSIAAAGTKSVEAAVLTSDFGSAPVLRLHGFNDAEATSAEISVSLNGSWEQEVAELPGEFLVRTTLEDGSQELQYQKVSVKKAVVTDTASTGEGKEGSIEAWTDSLGTQVLQVKGWDGTGTETTYALTAVSSDAGAVFESPDSQVTHFLIRQGEDAQNNLDMQYAKLKLTLPLSAMPAGSSVSADSDITSLSQKSIDKLNIDGKDTLQVHGFQDASQDPVTLEVRLGVNSGEDTMSCDAMLRTTGSGSKEVAYAPLKVKNMVTVDSLDRTAGGSIDTYLSETSDKEVICIRHWDTAASDVTLTASDLDMWATKTDEITLEAEGLGDVLSRKDGDMEYSTLKVALPICPQPDSEIAAATQSIERKMSGSVAYDQLYGFATKQPQEVKTTIVNGGIVTLFNGADVLVRSGSQLQYQKVQLSCPEISGDTSRIQDEINEITSQITSITADINILSGDVGDLSSALSGLDSKYWQQGGGASACYGSGIGDMGKDEVISLTDKKLVGIWQADDMTVNRDLDVTENALIGGDIYAAGDIVGAHVYANTGGTITIGSTTINEEQLKKLLALIG